MSIPVFELNILLFKKITKKKECTVVVIVGGSERMNLQSINLSINLGFDNIFAQNLAISP